MKNVLAWLYLLTLLNEQVSADTHSQRKGACSGCGSFMWCMYTNIRLLLRGSEEEGQSSNYTSKENFLFFIFK